MIKGNTDNSYYQATVIKGVTTRIFDHACNWVNVGAEITWDNDTITINNINGRYYKSDKFIGIL